ncbi:unnamed protein product [Paramecium sonneborni]|uniref:Uncharacterized protein n=1 Tax=Paramecium sonneborni TaxID=65129 RepID=A0A8S1RWJ3_9CILI|nr:unnamed protein product [Paramecium sonneborni]
MVLHPTLMLDKSAAFFKNTKVISGSYVRMKQGNPEVKNNIKKAVQFNEITNKTPAEHETKSTYTTSTYSYNINIILKVMFIK